MLLLVGYIFLCDWAEYPIVTFPMTILPITHAFWFGSNSIQYNIFEGPLQLGILDAVNWFDIQNGYNYLTIQNHTHSPVLRVKYNKISIMTTCYCRCKCFSNILWISIRWPFYCLITSLNFNGKTSIYTILL